MKKEEAGKEEYDQILLENNMIQDKEKLIKSDIHQAETRLGVLRKKITELGELARAKEGILKLLGPESEGIVSSDLKEANNLVKSLETRVSELEKENSKYRAEFRMGRSSQIYEDIDMHEDIKGKIKKMKELIANDVGTNEEFTYERKLVLPNEEQLRKEILNINNLEDIYKEIETFPNPLDSYEKSKVLLTKHNYRVKLKKSLET